MGTLFGGRYYWGDRSFCRHEKSEKEWYYENKSKERLGPCSYEEVSIVIGVGLGLGHFRFLDFNRALCLLKYRIRSN